LWGYHNLGFSSVKSPVIVVVEEEEEEEIVGEEEVSAVR
jgi:hypothetical protein